MTHAVIVYELKWTNLSAKVFSSLKTTTSTIRIKKQPFVPQVQPKSSTKPTTNREMAPKSMVKNQSHYGTRVIAYSCPDKHVVEYYHGISFCNMTPYAQSPPCANTPDLADNPSMLKASHYRLTTSSEEDIKGIRIGGRPCPVCERQEKEERWMNGRMQYQPHIGGNAEDEGGNGSVGSGGSALSRVPEDHSWLLEMPFLNIWQRVNGRWVDKRSYKSLLPGAKLNRHGDPWPLREYKGFAHRGFKWDPLLWLG